MKNLVLFCIFWMFCIHLNAQFTIVKIDSINNIGDFDIAIDNNNVPYVVYGDETNNLVKLAKWNGTSFDVETVCDMPDMGAAITFDGSNKPHIVYIRREGFDNPQLVYATKPTSSWDTTVLLTSSSLHKKPTISLDQNDNPVVFEKCNYYHFNGSSWIMDTISADNGISGSLVVDASGVMHAAYYVPSPDYKVYYVKKDGATREKTIIENDAEKNVIQPRIALLSDDTPVIGYGEEQQTIEYAVYNGSAWDTAEIGGVSQEGMDMAVYNNNPQFSVYKSYGIHHFSWDGSSNTDTEVEVFVESTLDESELAITSNGTACVVYVKNSTEGLKMAYNGSLTSGIQTNNISPTNITIAPVPASDYLTIVSTQANKIISVDILDEKGKILLSETIQNTEAKLDITKINSGIYIINALTEKGTINKKFIKE